MSDKKQTEKNRFEEQLTILETVIQDLRDVKNLPDILRRLNSLQREVFREIGQKTTAS